MRRSHILTEIESVVERIVGEQAPVLARWRVQGRASDKVYEQENQNT